MGLLIVETREVGLAGSRVRGLVADALARTGGAVVLAPTLAQALEAQRAMAGEPGLALGVTASAPAAWAASRWEVWGDGRHLVGAGVRDLLSARALERVAGRPGSHVAANPGTAALVADLAREGLAWIAPRGEGGGRALAAGVAGSTGIANVAGMAGAADAAPAMGAAGACGLSAAELEALEAVAEYGRELDARGLVEGCEACALLPGLLARAGVATPPVVLVGFSTMGRGARELVCGLARTGEVALVGRAGAGFAAERALGLAEALADEARARGIACEVEGNVAAHGALAGESPASGADTSHAGDAVPGRASELEGLLGALFAPEGVVAPVRPTGALRLLLPAGPSAEAELVAREVASRAAAGAAQVVIVAPDPVRAWRELAPKLVARGVSARAELRVPFASTQLGAALLAYVQEVARLAELEASWPQPLVGDGGGTQVVLGPMDWWPPRDLVELMLLDVSGVGADRARRLDASWRANRLLTPVAVLATLTDEGQVGPRLARATTELLRGRLGSFASKLLGAAAQPVPGAAGQGGPAEGEGPMGAAVGSPAVPVEPDPEAQSVLSAVLAVAGDLRDLGVRAAPAAAVAGGGAAPASARPGPVAGVAEATVDAAAAGGAGPAAAPDAGAVPVSLADLVDQAVRALARTQLVLRPRRALPGAACEALVTSAASAAALPSCSADVLVLCDQSSAASPLPRAGELLPALLEAAGVERELDPMLVERARFQALVRVPRQALVVERALFGADAKPTYPSVMLTELLACYGLDAGAGADELARALGSGAVQGLSETSPSANAASSGAAPQLVAVETPSPSGRLACACREKVLPPVEGSPLTDEPPLLSASQIESYLECPLKWFALRRLRLDDADAQLGGAEMGTFAHRVLEVSHSQMLARAEERLLGGHTLADVAAASPWGERSVEYAAEVERLVALAQEDPAARVPGSRVAGLGLAGTPPEEARQLVLDEFGAHLAHQYLTRRGRPVQPQALVAHTASDQGAVDALRDDLASLVDYEAEAFAGFEPRFFEWRFGARGEVVEYAGVRLTGTVDRVDVDAHGQAVVIDYKHKSPAGFTGEYDAFGPDGPGGVLVLPRRVQSLIYAQVVRRAHPELRVRGAVYLCTKGDHAIAGAVDEGLLDLVFGAHAPSPRRAPRVAVPRTSTFGQVTGTCGLEALLDAVEGAIAERLRGLTEEGHIEADPVDAKACEWCPVLNCTRRLQR